METRTNLHPDSLSKWHQWFAWSPVKLEYWDNYPNGHHYKIFWWENVWRIRVYGPDVWGGYFRLWYYLPLNENPNDESHDFFKYPALRGCSNESFGFDMGVVLRILFKRFFKLDKKVKKTKLKRLAAEYDRLRDEEFRELGWTGKY